MSRSIAGVLAGVFRTAFASVRLRVRLAQQFRYVFLNRWGTRVLFVLVGLVLAAFCSGDEGPAARKVGQAPLHRVPAIRRIYVPAATPSRWPKGDWDPIPQVELDRRLRRLRDESPESGLERAEYRALLVGDSFEEGHLQWKSRSVTGRPRYLSLSPSNLGLGRLEWTRSAGEPRPAIWGTGPDGNVGLLLDGPESNLTGTWSLVGRRLPRSLEFTVQLPEATVSRLSLELPSGLRLSSSAGEVTGPRAGTSPDLAVWDLDLGSRTECRLWITTPGVESTRRPLAISQMRTNYVVRPEVVRVLAEIEIEAFESNLRELRIQADPGIQVVAVEHGDEAGVTWKAEARPEGELITVSLAEPISFPAQVLRVRGIAAIKPGEAWSLPQLHAVGTIPAERLVTVRMQPPFQAADLRLTGFRQTELTAVPNEGETVVLRQIAEVAALVVVPAEPRIEALCRSLSLVEFQREEWSCVAQLDLQASAGSTFEADFDVPEGWDIVSVRSETSQEAGELNHWETSNGADGQSRLHVDFQSTLESTRPQRIRITARRPALAAGEWFAVPMFSCRGGFSRDATTVFVAPEGFRPIFRELAGVELSSFSDLAAEQKLAEPLKTLPTPESAVVVRSVSPTGKGQMTLRQLHVPLPAAGQEGSAAARGHSPATGPLVATKVEAVVELSRADSGFDLVRLDLDLVGSDERRLTFELPGHSELISVSVDGEPAHAEVDDRIAVVDLRESTGELGRRLSIEYRLPARRIAGPNRLKLELPRFPFAVMQFQAALHVPSTLRSRASGDVVEWALERQAGPAHSLLGPLGRVGGEELFRPWRASSWWRLWERLAVSEVEPEPADRSLDSATLWRGTSLSMPGALEVDVWGRIELDSLEWALTLALILSSLAMRRIVGQWRRRVALLALSTLVVLAFSGLPWFDELAGSALTGLALGVLVPTSFLVRRDSSGNDSGQVPSGSTRTFTHGFSLTVLALLSLAFSAHAQEPAAQSLPEPLAVATEDVLVPVGTDGKPVGPDPLCYVRAGFLNELQRLQFGRAIPDWLIARESVEHVVTGIQEARITVRLDVFVLSQSDSVRVDLPIRNAVFAEADSCLVDGKPQPVLLSPGGRGIAVELPGLPEVERASPVPLPEGEAAPDTVAPAHALDRPLALKHSVELRLRALVEPEGSELLRSRLSLPKVADATVALKSELPAIKWLEVRGPGLLPRQAVSISEAPVSPVTVRGLLEDLEFRWSVGNPPARRATELDVSISAMVDVSPGLARSTWHVGGRILSGTVDGFALTLPAGATLESVQSPGMGGFVVEPAANGRRHLILEYGSPQTGNLSVIVSLLQPLASLESPLSLVELAERPDLPNRTTLRRCQLGFRQPLDFRLSVTGAAELVVRPRAVDEFLKDWPIAGARPQQAIDVARPGTLQLTLQELSGRLTSRADVRGRFSPGLLDWTLSAEIEQPVVPPFQYRLSIDPRLVIRRVTVQEDGAERLLRWSRLRDMLVLFLNDRAARGQTIRVEATTSIPLSGDLVLPRIELEGARNEGVRVSLFREAGASVSLIDGPPDALVQESPAGSGQVELIARYDQSAESPPQRVRILPAGPGVTFESTMLVEPQGDRFELTAAFEFKVTSGRPGRFDLRMPREIAERYKFTTVPESQQLMEPTPEGDALLSFFPVEPVGDRFLLRVQLPVELGVGAAMPLPRFSSPGARQGPRWLILPRDRRSEFPPGEIPVWFPANAGTPVDGGALRAYRLPDADIPPLIQIPAVGDARPTGAAVADYKLEFHDDGSCFGRLLLWLPDGPAESLEFAWPTDAVASAALIDGASVPLPVTGSEWSLPLRALHSLDGAKLVWLSWRSPTRASSLAHRFHDQLPRPKVPIAVEIFDVRIASGFVPSLDDEARSGQSIDAELARWQAALDSIGESPSGKAVSLVMPYVRQVAKRAARAVDDAGNSISPVVQKRLDELDVRTHRLDVPDVRIAPQNRAADALAETVPDPDVHSAGVRSFVRRSSEVESGSDPILSPGVWGLRRTPLLPMVGVALGLALALVLRKAGRLIAWIQDRESVCWLLIGVLWWLVLRPGPLGLLLVVWASWSLIRSARRLRPENGSVPR